MDLNDCSVKSFFPQDLERFQIDRILKDVLSYNLSVTKSVHNVLMMR
jgi:hypothetical protein